jgi:hypothetical protein
MENITSYIKSNEYSFRWGKQFNFLTLKTLESKLVVSSTFLTVETDKYYLGFIKGKKSTVNIPISDISHIEIKNLFSLPDLIVALFYFLLGEFLNPLFYLIIPLSVWASCNTNLIITTKSDQVVKIPSFSKKDANDFRNYFNDIYLDA